MLTRRRFTLLSGLVAALLIAAVARAQSAPPPLGTDITSAVELSAKQIEQVRAVVAYWAAILNNESSKPADIERARDELSRPLNQPGGNRLVTPNFRGTYSSAVLPELEKTLAGKHIYRSINAIRVASVLGTDRAANFLLLNSDLDSQPQWEVRLRAADGLRLLFLGSTIDSRKTADAVRKLRDASIREDNWLVLRNLLASMSQADAGSVAAGDRKLIRGYIGEAMTSAVQRAAASQQVSGPMLLAMGSATSALRQNFTNYKPEEQSAVGVTLGPALGKLLDWARTHWEEIKGDPQTDAQATTFVASAEGLLQFFDPVLVQAARPTPTSDMRTAWMTSDKPKYETGVQAWQGVLVKSPYRP